MICKECGVPVKSNSNFWHVKNALIGISLWLLFMVLGAMLVAFALQSAPGHFDRNMASKISALFFFSFIGVTYGILFIISKRAEKKALSV